MTKQPPPLAANVWANLPAFRPAIMRAQKFVIPASTALDIVESSYADWREWYPRVFAPYPTTWIEADATHLDNPQFPLDHATKLGWLWDGDTITPFMSATGHPAERMPITYSVKGEDNLGKLRLRIEQGKPDLEPVSTAVFGRVVGWGAPLVEKYGATPEYGVTFDPYIVETMEKLNFNNTDAAALHMAKLLITEFSGNARIAFAATAYINDKTPVEIRPKAAHLIKGTPTPGMVFRTVRLRPPPVKVLDPGGPAEEHVSTPRKEHKVRQHARTYKKSGRTIIVQSYKRGDPSLGTVEHDYRLAETRPTQ